MNISSTAVQVPMVLQLEAEGLLRTQQVRRALEVEAVRLAALNHARIDKDELRGLADTLLATVERGDPWREADAAFHAAIYRASGNPLFEQIIEQLHAAFHRVYVEPFNDDSYGIASMPAHRDLAEAVIAGEDAEAVRIITEIMDTTESEIKRLMGKR
jgi:DNA-binding FadR family transcriptional regulator